MIVWGGANGALAVLDSGGSYGRCAAADSPMPTATDTSLPAPARSFVGYLLRLQRVKERPGRRAGLPGGLRPVVRQ